MKIFILLILSANCFAFSVKSYEKKGRPLVERFLGVKIANSVFGKTEPKVELPELPKLKRENIKNIKPSIVLDTQGAKYKSLSNEDKRKYRFAFLTELFSVTRMSEATDDDIGKWLNTLEQGSSREGIYRALVLDQVYYQLENFDDPSNEKVIKFASEMMTKYVGEIPNKHSMSKLNAYTVKRIICSKLLDMLEVLSPYEIKVYKWYAVLSSDLGQKYSPVFKNTLRKNPDPLVHYEWAKQVPLDQIKTETVLKVHRIFNQLMK